MRMLQRVVLISASVALLLGLLACGESSVSNQPVPEPTVGRTVTEATATPPPVPATAVPSPTPSPYPAPTATRVPTPTGTGDKEFAAQRTRLAPTLAAVVPLAACPSINFGYDNCLLVPVHNCLS